MQALTDAVTKGARHADIESVEVIVKPPLQAVAEDVLNANAVILGTTENFGYMSGALKDFFERVYYACLEKTEAMPYALFVKGGLDGTGAKSSVERIVTGLRWHTVQEATVFKGDFDPAWLEPCEELGMAMAAGLDAGIF